MAITWRNVTAYRKKIEEIQEISNTPTITKTIEYLIDNFFYSRSEKRKLETQICELKSKNKQLNNAINALSSSMKQIVSLSEDNELYN